MSNYIASTGRTIAWDFSEFDRRNPLVYEYFKRFAAEACKRKKKTSAKLIIERIRWEIIIETNSADEFKINNNFTSHYARKYINEYPNHKEYFELRTLRSL